jgi:transposase
MDRAPLPDLNSLDREDLLALFTAQQEQLDSLIADRDAEIRRLEAELDSHRQTLSDQAVELRSRSERIEHLKLMVDKLRHVIFGTKSEKIIIKLEQMELELEDDETTHAELEAGAERVSPAKEPKTRPMRKPLPEHLSREVVTHTPSGDCCADCGGQLRQFGEMSLNSWSTSPTASRSSVTCGRSSLAQAVIASLKHLLPHVRSSAGFLHLVCLPT